MVNTELIPMFVNLGDNYNILNIVVNTERDFKDYVTNGHYNILNIVVNTEL